MSIELETRNMLQNIKQIITNPFFIGSTIFLVYNFYRTKIIKMKIQENQKQIQKKQKQNQENIQEDYNMKSINSPEKQNQQKNKKMSENVINNKITKICITGGPCAGKTSGLSYLAEKLQYDGFSVFVVPEVATLIASGGGMIDMHSYTVEQGIEFQINLMETQIQLENMFMNIASLGGKPAIVLCDRGLMDGSVYIEPDQWRKLLNRMQKTELQIRDQFYNAVIHLVTTADGAETAYTFNNSRRHESPKLAIQLDRKLQLAWLAHPRYEIVDNISVNTFEEKLEKLLHKVRLICGVQGFQKHFYRRYLLEKCIIEFPENINVQEFFIEDHFIHYETQTKDKQTVGKFTKIRRRQSSEGDYLFLLSMSKIVQEKQSITSKKTLQYKEYLMYLSKVDERRQSLMKQRKIFMDEGFQYIIDTFLNIKGGFSILRVKLEDKNQKHSIPKFINVIRDVTEEQGYKSKYLSKKNWYAPQEDETTLQAHQKLSADEN